MEMMSASSSQNVSQKEDKVQQLDNDCKIKWLEDFLGKTFFDSCTAHPYHKNGLSRYCINCDLPVCKYCASSSTHDKHKALKIYRQKYKDTVTLAAMEKHIDCSQIQPYKCNGHLVIVLKPLPLTGSAKWDKPSSCNICSRKLAEPHLYSYCSISCKVEAASRKPNDSVPPFISIQSHPWEKNEGTNEPWKQLNWEKKEETTESRKHLNKEKEEETTKSRKRLNKEKEGTAEPEPLNKEMEETVEPLNKEKEESTEPPKRKHRRKGIPHRAPFF